MEPAFVKREPSEESLLIIPPAMEHEQEPQQVEVKREPSEDFLLIPPPVTEDEPEFVPIEVKREPSEEFVLIIPQPTEDEPKPAQPEVVKPKRKRSKKLTGSPSVFKCDQCSFQTNKKRNLTQHKGIHNKSKSCETCQKKFSTNRTLKRHQMQHKHGIYETAEETFDCDSCKKSFRTRHHLDKHQRNVHDENKVKCGVCGAICKNRALLHNHSINHVQVECSICHKTIHKKSMAVHKLMHSTEKPFDCDLCEHSTKTKKNLKAHIERKHLLRQLVNDSKCRADFSDFGLLEELQLKHGIVTASSERKFNCNKCSKVFTTPLLLKQHKTGVHPEKTLECETCKKSFKTRSNLNKHKANVHSKVSCSICGKKFGQRYMKTHMKLHLPGRHFECDFCGYNSVRKIEFSRHINARHRSSTLKRNFGCNSGPRCSSTSVAN